MSERTKKAAVRVIVVVLLIATLAGIVLPMIPVYDDAHTDVPTNTVTTVPTSPSNVTTTPTLPSTPIVPGLTH